MELSQKPLCHIRQLMTFENSNRCRAIVDDDFHPVCPLDSQIYIDDIIKIKRQSFTQENIYTFETNFLEYKVTQSNDMEKFNDLKINYSNVGKVILRECNLNNLITFRVGKKWTITGTAVTHPLFDKPMTIRIFEIDSVDEVNSTFTSYGIVYKCTGYNDTFFSLIKLMLPK